MEKYKIEKDSVQETLIIPLYGRRLCSRRFPGLYQDTTAAILMETVDYDFSPLERRANGLTQTFGALEVAMRQNDLAWEVRDYLNAHPRAAVINLGCGLDNTGRACDNGRCSIWNIDLPDVIELRDRLLPAGERTGKGALFVAEQFTFYQVFIKSRAIDCKERAVGPQAFIMNTGGDDFFSSAGLAP